MNFKMINIITYSNDWNIYWTQYYHWLRIIWVFVYVCVSENAAALEELLLEYENKQMSISKGSSIKYETAHRHTHKSSYTFTQSFHLRLNLRLGQGKFGREQESKNFGWGFCQEALLKGKVCLRLYVFVYGRILKQMHGEKNFPFVFT